MNKRTKAPPSFAALVQAWFAEYLTQQRTLSAQTIAAYRDSFVLFLEFAEPHLGKSPATMTLADVTPELIMDFLDHLEPQRHNCVRSRNARLAALRSFLKFAAHRDVALLQIIERALGVPVKRFERPMFSYLSREEMLAVIGTPDDEATCDPAIYGHINWLIRDKCDIILNNSTGGGISGDMVRELDNGLWEIQWEERLKGMQGDGVEICTLDAQTVIASFNGKEILVATPPSRIRQIAEMVRERGIKPEWEVFGLADIVQMFSGPSTRAWTMPRTSLISSSVPMPSRAHCPTRLACCRQCSANCPATPSSMSAPSARRSCPPR
jgi:hypothetical protein